MFIFININIKFVYYIYKMLMYMLNDIAFAAKLNP